MFNGRVPINWATELQHFKGLMFQLNDNSMFRIYFGSRSIVSIRIDANNYTTMESFVYNSPNDLSMDPVDRLPDQSTVIHSQLISPMYLRNFTQTYMDLIEKNLIDGSLDQYNNALWRTHYNII